MGKQSETVPTTGESVRAMPAETRALPLLELEKPGSCNCASGCGCGCQSGGSCGCQGNCGR
jgi:hypothetical protein